MYRIRYYDRMFHPDVISKKGFLGRSIHVLNFLRWKLETFVQYLVLKYMTKEETSLNPDERRSALDMFRLSVEQEKLHKKATSPLIALPSDKVAKAFTVDGVRCDAIKEQNERLLGDRVPHRPKPIDELAARYANNTRSKRYARGSVLYVNEDFEPVED